MSFGVMRRADIPVRPGGLPSIGYAPRMQTEERIGGALALPARTSSRPLGMFTPILDGPDAGWIQVRGFTDADGGSVLLTLGDAIELGGILLALASCGGSLLEEDEAPLDTTIAISGNPGARSIKLIFPSESPHIRTDPEDPADFRMDQCMAQSLGFGMLRTVGALSALA